MKYKINFELELKKHKYPGKLIAFEGSEASGKTTHAKALVERLKKEGVKAVFTKEPTSGPIAELIRKILGGEIRVAPITLQYLFCADRAEHQGEIVNWLKEDYVVVSDRYLWSAVAYGIADLDGKMDFYLTAFSVLSFYRGY